MTGESAPRFDPELLEVSGDDLVARLLDEESGEVVRAVVRDRTDLHNWLCDVLVEWGDFDERFIQLLLVMLPEFWLRHPDGVAFTLRSLLDQETRPSATVAAAREWVVNARLGNLDHLYPGLSAWIVEQGL